MNDTFIAVEKLKYMKPSPVFRKHMRVVQVGTENSRKGTRSFKCLDCGGTWTESIHSPLIITARDIRTYYPAARNCSTF